MSPLLDISPEILLRIHYDLNETRGVFKLAASYSTLQKLFKFSMNRMQILQSVACRGKSLTDELEAAFSCGYWYSLSNIVATEHHFQPSSKLIHLLGRFTREMAFLSTSTLVTTCRLNEWLI